MSRLIDADALKKAIANHTFWTIPGIVYRIIDNQSTVDAEPVIHGEWIDGRSKHGYVCSECYGAAMKVKTKYCPFCGARMDGGNEDGT